MRLSESAQADLADIWTWLSAEASDAIATRFVSVLLAALKPLETLPYSGSLRPSLGAGLRVIFHARYALYYRALETEIVVVRVLHGARDARAVAARRGFED